MQQKELKILICGNYGINNLGDEAILEGIIKVVQSAFPSSMITVLSSDPKQTRKIHQIRAVSFWPSGFRSFFKFIFQGHFLGTIKSYWQTDLFILGGGGLFTDEKPRAILIWLMQTLPAVFFRKKIFCLGQSIGPLKSNWSKTITRFVFQKAKKITVRDNESSDLLQHLGIKDVKVLADPAFALAYDQETLFNRKNFVVLSLRPWIKGNHEKIEQELANFILWLYEKHQLRTLFIPFQIDQENDLKRYEILSRVIDEQLKTKKVFQHDEKFRGEIAYQSEQIFECFDQYQDMHKVITAIASSQLLIGMRLHSIIFAVLTRTPFIGLSYSQKVKNFIGGLGLNKEYTQGFLDYEELDFEKLKEHFLQIQRKRKEIIQQLEKAKLQSTYMVFDHVKLLQEAIN